MKKLILITLLLIPFLGISQTTKPIDGFLGIKFGTSKADVIAAMQTKGATLDPGSKDDLLFFTGVKLGHRDADFLEVKLFNGNAYSGVLIFSPENEASTLSYYNDLVSDISGAYGKGKPTTDFKDPYKYGDGNETLAISNSEGFMFTDWNSGDKSIQVDINTKLKVLLFYTDDATEKLAKAAEKAKEKSDY